MTEQLRQILNENGIQYLDLRPLRPPDAEIPVHKLTLEGSRLGAWQALKNLIPKTGLYPVHLDDEYLEYIIEKRWEDVRRKLDGHEAVVLPNYFDEYLLGLNNFLLGKDPRGLDIEYQPMTVLEYYRGADGAADEASQKQPQPVDLFLLPVRHSWEALALCDTDGRLSAGPTEIAWARRWAKKYGACLYETGGSAMQWYHVARPPRTILQAIELSSELLYSGFADDLVGQNYLTEQYYTLELMNRTQWEFWWD
jgi:hypothetical protein